MRRCERTDEAARLDLMSASERAAFEAHATTCEDCRDAAAFLGSTAALLRASARTPDADQLRALRVGVAKKTARSPWRSWAWIAAPVAVAAALVVVFVAPSGSPVTSGAVRHAGAVVSGALPEGPTLSADPGTTIAYADATLRAEAATELAVAQGPSWAEVRLERGAMRFDVRPRVDGARFVVKTPHTEVRVVGTRFEVRVLAAYTDVAVDEGVVEVRDGERVVRVAVGGALRVPRTGESARRDEGEGDAVTALGGARFGDGPDASDERAAASAGREGSGAAASGALDLGDGARRDRARGASARGDGADGALATGDASAARHGVGNGADASGATSSRAGAASRGNSMEASRDRGDVGARGHDTAARSAGDREGGNNVDAHAPAGAARAEADATASSARASGDRGADGAPARASGGADEETSTGARGADGASFDPGANAATARASGAHGADGASEGRGANGAAEATSTGAPGADASSPVSAPDDRSPRAAPPEPTRTPADWLTHADALRRADAFTEAAAAYAEAAAAPQLAEEAQWRRAEMLAEAGDPEAALAVLADSQRRFGAGRLAPERAALTAKVAVDAGEFERAVEVLEAAGTSSYVVRSARLEIGARLVTEDPTLARRMVEPLLGPSQARSIRRRAHVVAIRAAHEARDSDEETALREALKEIEDDE